MLRLLFVKDQNSSILEVCHVYSLMWALKHDLDMPCIKNVDKKKCWSHVINHVF